MKKRIYTNLKKAIYDYQLIEENDKICIGISGGKDSMALAISLKQLQKSLPIKFEIVCINLQLGFDNMDFQEVHNFFKKHNIEFYQVETKIKEILEINKNKDGSLQCSICSKFKKALIIDAAKKLGCNKVCFGHHSDDAIETLFMNAIYGGRLATFKPKMYLDRTDITFIRPFIYIRESEITNYIIEESIPVVISTCPNDGYTKRQETKELLSNIYQQFPEAKKNFLLMLHNLEKLDLWEKPSNPLSSTLNKNKK
ncbi:MAG: ATP-binding protein [Erysipelotrichaceae bacterium]